MGRSSVGKDGPYRSQLKPSVLHDGFRLTGHDPITAVSYGTEAGLYQQAGIDAIVCGPGDIGRAHRPNEYIELGELAECQTFIEAFAARLAV